MTNLYKVIFYKLIVVAIFILVISNVINAQYLWEKLDNNLEHITALETNDPNLLYAGTTEGFYVSTDQGNSWVKTEVIDNEFDNNVEKIRVLPNDRVIFITFLGQVHESKDFGYTWKKAKKINDETNDIFITADNRYYAAGFDSIYVSSDRGNSWKSIPPPPPILTWSIYVDENKGIYAGTHCGFYYSADNGNSWNLLRSFNCGDINEIIVSNGDLYICGSDRFHGIYKLEKGSWRELTGIKMHSFDFLVSNSKIYATSDNQDFHGIFVSSDIDTIWNFISMDSVFTKKIAINNEGQIFVAGYKRLDYSDGRFGFTKNELYRGIKEITDVSSKQYLVNPQIELIQNYPNPFNPTTVISFILKESSHVLLEIYDYLGQKVITLVDKNLSSGFHKINFEAKDISGGIYFYRIKAERFIKTNKMVLLK